MSHYYRLYWLDGAHIVGAEEIFAVDDADAISQALVGEHRGLSELWAGGRKVKVFQDQENAG